MSITLLEKSNKLNLDKALFNLCFRLRVTGRIKSVAALHQNPFVLKVLIFNKWI
jgi:hypothetical protein